MAAIVLDDLNVNSPDKTSGHLQYKMQNHNCKVELQVCGMNDRFSSISSHYDTSSCKDCKMRVDT